MDMLVIITGASRGFGKALVHQFVAQYKDTLKVDLILMARDANQLQMVVEECLPENKQILIKPHIVEMDLSDLKSVEEKCGVIMKTEYKKGYLFQNAGSIGQLDFIQNWSSIEDLRSYFDRFGAARPIGDMERQVPIYTGVEDKVSEEEMKKISYEKKHSVIVNVSSLAAKEAFHCMNMYCTGKAARHMHFKAIAKEQGHESKLAVLNYSPGPMDTDMQTTIRNTESNYKPNRDYFQSLKQTNGYVDVEASAKRCVQLVLDGRFISGDHIDYYDCK